MFTSYIVNFKKFDCCGSTGSHGFRDHVNSAGYGSVSGYQPYMCCHDYKYTQSYFLHNTYCEKKVKPFTPKLQISALRAIHNCNIPYPLHYKYTGLKNWMFNLYVTFKLSAQQKLTDIICRRVVESSFLS